MAIKINEIRDIGFTASAILDALKEYSENSINLIQV